MLEGPLRNNQQSWARFFKIMLRLAPVRPFQMVSRLALFRIFQQKKIRVISLSRHRVSRQENYVALFSRP